jgi:hypothetical protein
VRIFPGTNRSWFFDLSEKHIVAQYSVTNHGFTLYDKTELVALLQEHQLQVTLVDELVEPPQDMWGTEMKRESVVVVCSTPGGQ